MKEERIEAILNSKRNLKNRKKNNYVKTISCIKEKNGVLHNSQNKIVKGEAIINGGTISKNVYGEKIYLINLVNISFENGESIGHIHIGVTKNMYYKFKFKIGERIKFEGTVTSYFKKIDGVKKTFFINDVKELKYA